MSTCVIMQPTYLPWLGYFDLIKNSDTFIFLDHVNFSKQSWQQRNRIRDKKGEIMLTVPVHKPKNDENSINKILIDYLKIPHIKHLKSIKACYGKSKNFKKIFDELKKIYDEEHKFLVDLNLSLINYGCEKLKIDSKIQYSSLMNIEGKKIDGIIEICKKVNSDIYLSPIGASDYIKDSKIFLENKIRLKFQNYDHPVYNQMGYNNFISHLSFIDYLFNI